MTTVNISLDSIDKVKSFVNDITKFDSDFDLIAEKTTFPTYAILYYNRIDSGCLPHI